MIDTRNRQDYSIEALSDDDAWFNGFSFIHDIKVRPVKSSMAIAPSMSAVNESIPGKYGNYYEGTDFESREIAFQIFAKCGTDERLEQEIRENIAQVFIKPNTSNVAKEYTLVFGNQKATGFGETRHKEYVGHFTNIGTPQYLHDDATRDFTVDLTFECSDPRAYLPLKKIQGTIESNDKAQVLLDYYDGTAPAEFKAEVMFADPKGAKHLGLVTDSGGVMAVGDDNDEVGSWSSSSGTSETNNLIPIKWDETNLMDISNAVSGTLANWETDQTSVKENFANIQWGHDAVGQTIGGSVRTDGTKITVGTRKVKGYKPSEYPKNKELKATDGKNYSVQDYGTDTVMRTVKDGKPNGCPWYGPVIVSTGIIASDTSTDLSNFKVTFRIHHTKFGKGHPHNSRAMGDIEFMLLDGKNNAFFRTGIKDSDTGEAPALIMQFCKPGSKWTDKANVQTLVYDTTTTLKGTAKKNDQSVKVPYKTTTIKTQVKKVVSKTTRRSSSTSTRTTKSKRRGKHRSIRVSKSGNTTTTTTTHGNTSTSTTTKAVDKKLYQYSYHTEKTKNETNAFSNGWVEVTVSCEFGKFYVEAHKLDGNGKPDSKWSFTKYKNKPVPLAVAVGNPVLSRVACGFFKHSIMEDTVTPFEIYKSCSLTMTHCSVWAMNQEYFNMYAPKTALKHPDFTISRGDVVEFNSMETKVLKNYTPTQPTWGTNYPSLEPQHLNTITFKSDGNLAGATYLIQWCPRLL